MAHPFAAALRTTHITHRSAVAHQTFRFGKNARPAGNPVASAKPTLRFIPPPNTNLVNLELALSVVLPEEAAAAQAAGQLVFHSVGDTGGIHGDDVQTAIAHAMDAQRAAAEAAGQLAPSFFYNLGDVVYFNGLSDLYDSQFYEPYQDYHAAIFAIAGNHDGDTKTRNGDPVDSEPPLFGFMANFCDPVGHNVSAYRPTMTQPYVYGTLHGPFTTIIGLYSNVDGSLDARGTNEQYRWLAAQIAAAPKDDCLLIAVHHPPYSLDTTHGGYPDIGVALDNAIQATGRIPDAVLSGHVHSYQRFERTLGQHKVPYIVAGAGGYANTPKLMHKIELTKSGKPLPKDFQTTLKDVKLARFNDVNPGYLRVSVNNHTRKLLIEYFVVPFAGTPKGIAFDSIEVGF